MIQARRVIPTDTDGVHMREVTRVIIEISEDDLSSVLHILFLSLRRQLILHHICKFFTAASGTGLTTLFQIAGKGT